MGWSALPRDKKFGGFQLRYGYYREEKQPCFWWKSNNSFTALLLVVTIPTMLYRSSCGHHTGYAIPIPWSSANLKRIRTVRQVFSIALRSSTLFGSASLNVLPCSSYQWCHSSHCVAATDMAINARVAKDVDSSDRSLIFGPMTVFSWR
jgi:hypothetical protein